MVKEIPKGYVCWVCEKETNQSLYRCTVDFKPAFIHEQCWIDVTPIDLRHLLPSHIQKKYKINV